MNRRLRAPYTILTTALLTVLTLLTALSVSSESFDSFEIQMTRVGQFILYFSLSPAWLQDCSSLIIIIFKLDRVILDGDFNIHVDDELNFS